MSTYPERIKAFTLLYGARNYHYRMDNGVFVVLIKESAVGFFIDTSSADDSKIHEAIRDAGKLLNTPLFTEIKLIGEPSVALKLQSLFSKYGRVKVIPKEGPQELLFFPQENRTRLAPLDSTDATPSPEPKPVIANKKVKVLIVDDSKTIRTLLKKIFSQSDRIEIVADTGNPLDVIQLIHDKKPDVITLDIHMPKMDGLTLLKKYITNHPVPTVMITSISMEEGPTVLNALEAGAVDYIKKPEMNELTEASELIIDKVLSASTARVTVHKTASTSSKGVGLDKEAFIAIGASTGGTEALRVLLTQLPAEIPPILIVQHIPAGFSNAFAKRLNSLCQFEVIEAQDQDEILKNRVLIAPGGKQMRAVCRGRKWYVVVEDTPPVNRHKPSVDHLFNSLVEFDFKKPVGIILTGMGGDGAKGLLNLKNKGWMTIAQDKESCVVFGMPAVAIDLGAAQHVCSLHDIPQKIQQLIPAKRAA